MKTVTMGAIAGLLLGGLGGFLWWGLPLQDMREEVQALKSQRKDRRSKLEVILSRGQK
jgi:hypothetical protein